MRHRALRLLPGTALTLTSLLVGGGLRAEAPASPTAEHASDSAAPTAESSEPRRQRILIMDLTPVGVDKSMVTVLGGLITDAVARYPNLQTISTSDIRNLVELESGKQQVGCDSNSCLAEVAGAMGARYVIFGNVGMLGSTTVVQLSLFDADKAQAVARRSIKVSSHDELAAAVEPAMADLLRGLLPEGQQPVATTPVAPTVAASTTGDNDLGWVMWTGGILGGLSALAFAGTYFGGLALAYNVGAPNDYLKLILIPVAGPVLAADHLKDDDGAPSWALPMSYGAGGVEALMVLGSIAGLGIFSLGRGLDGDGLPLAGHLWQWGLLGLGGGLAAGGLALDFFPESSRDHQVDLFDAIPLAMYGAAALSVGAGLLFNPFEEGE